jgi:plasmid stabilization system protein ParE
MPIKRGSFQWKRLASVSGNGFQNRLHRKALVDLEAILDYILADNPAAASRFGSDLLNHVELLGAFPHIGSPVTRRAGIRKILHTPVRVYYRIASEPSHDCKGVVPRKSAASHSRRRLSVRPADENHGAGKPPGARKEQEAAVQAAQQAVGRGP